MSLRSLSARLDSHPALACVLACLAAAGASLAGVFTGNPVALALLNLAVGAAAMFHFLHRNQTARAAACVLLWAYALGASMVVWTVLFPERAEAAVWRGAEYKAEMFRYLETGEGAEGDPRLFLPQHAVHLGVFVALGALSVGVLGLLMGVLLTDYMAFYAGSVLLMAHDKPLAALLVWPPWALLRMAGFVLVGVSISASLYRRFRGGAWNWREHRARFLWAMGLLLADVALKALLAPRWREWLLAAME